MLGAVNRPGNYSLPEGQPWTILEALAEAGDLKATANKQRIEFWRDGKLEKLSYDQIKEEESKEEGAHVLQPGDRIIVGQKLF